MKIQTKTTTQLTQHEKLVRRRNAKIRAMWEELSLKNPDAKPYTKFRIIANALKMTQTGVMYILRREGCFVSSK